MKTLGAMIFAVLLAVGILGAQAPSGGSVAFNIGTTSCQNPATGLALLCGTTTGVEMSVNGAPYASIVGPAGSAGPPGPNWSTCTGVTLTPTGITGGVVSYTLTVVPTNCK
jgi:hypothetical protein